MAFAMDIKAPLVLQEEVISAKSWNDNPMGVAFTIKAPEPPIPQEPIPFAEVDVPEILSGQLDSPDLARNGIPDSPSLEQIYE